MWMRHTVICIRESASVICWKRISLRCPDWVKIKSVIMPIRRIFWLPIITPYWCNITVRLSWWKNSRIWIRLMRKCYPALRMTNVWTGLPSNSESCRKSYRPSVPVLLTDWLQVWQPKRWEQDCCFMPLPPCSMEIQNIIVILLTMTVLCWCHRLTAKRSIKWLPTRHWKQ